MNNRVVEIYVLKVWIKNSTLHVEKNLRQNSGCFEGINRIVEGTSICVVMKLAQIHINYLIHILIC